MYARRISLVAALLTCSFPNFAALYGAVQDAELTQHSVRCTVTIEEVVTDYVPAGNGAGPLWCYGSTVIAAWGDDLFLSIIETGKDVPLLCNTRWQLWHRSAGDWRLAQYEPNYRQREPCPIAVAADGRVFLSVNPSTEPPGTKYGPCRPKVLEFDGRNPAAPFETHWPEWTPGSCFTDHSYRGFAADGSAGELLLLNINAQTGAYFVSHCDADGDWRSGGTLTFPIRACYPQVALRDSAAHVLAIGDIVEPVEEWRKLKFDKLGRKWDYVFRRLFYSYTPDLTRTTFRAPIEIDSVEDTCGHIQNLDLHVDETGTSHLLYLKRPFQYAFIRDACFPGRPMTASLEYVTVKDGGVVSRRTVLETPQDGAGIEPSFARFHIMPDGSLLIFAAGTETEKGRKSFGNFVLPVGTARCVRPVRVRLQHPFRNFFTATPRAGSSPSMTAHLFGIAGDSLNLRYAQIRISTDLN